MSCWTNERICKLQKDIGMSFFIDICYRDYTSPLNNVGNQPLFSIGFVLNVIAAIQDGDR